jgi:hypothetical protein
MPPEIRNLNETIEKFRGKIKFVAEHLQHPRKIQIAGWTANVSSEDLNCSAKICISSGSSNALPENRKVQRRNKQFGGRTRTSPGKLHCSAENPDRRRKTKSSAGK